MTEKPVASGETMSVPESFIRKSGSHYVLKVRGNSMVDAHISDGDFAVLDWEEAQRYGLPLWDLWYLLADATAHLDRVRTASDRLRHFEQLNNTETADVLGITPSGASSRYLRALKRLKDIIGQVPGFIEG